ncbi:MAG: AAA family ATPase [Actinomycetes bacterium]
MPRPQLLSLSVRGLGVIEDSTLDFSDGFTVITGETGAGKTLLVDALTLCLGGDARSPRRGAEMVTSAVFLDGDGIEVSLQRSLTSGSRLKAVLNGIPTSSEALRATGDQLLALHGQHDSLQLKSRAEVLSLVDSFGSIDTSSLVGLRHQLSALRTEQSRLGGSDDDRTKEREFIGFQVREIESAKIISVDELENSIDELIILSSVREQQGTIAALLELADGDDGSLLDSLAGGVAALGGVGAVGEARKSLAAVIGQFRSILSELRVLSDNLEADAERIDQLNGRVEHLRMLNRKYGGSLEAVLTELVTLSDRSAFLDSATSRSVIIQDEIDSLELQLIREAARIRSLRTTTANRLTHLVQEQLVRVALPNAQMSIEIDGDDGSEIDIQFRPNPGASAGSLQTIASGGELSRILLALSLVTASDNLVTVFDEIDAGVGGNVAQSIGECLADLSRNRQVIAVTHLATVAAKAEHHFVVEKTVSDGQTTTVVRRLSDLERPAEVARMLAGDGAVSEALALARQLLAGPS